MRDHSLNVYNLPRHVVEQDLERATGVIIDLLRATSTICYALAAGAREVVPFRTIEETLAAAGKAGRDRVVLGGERGGRQIDGFDLGNSPREYTPEAIRGRPVYITTTNGTQALHHARLAERVIVGAMMNLSAVAESISEERRVDILCAGTDGGETREDILAAGALVSRIRELSRTCWRTNDAADTAVDRWNKLLQSAAAAGRSIIQQLAIELRDTRGGRNLIDIGLEQDLADAAQIDRLSVVPELDVHTWRIVLPPR
jgi:2-phosphosulfolactate phosphatase